MLWSWLRHQHNLRMEQRACDARGDGDQLPLAVENLYLPGARKLGQVDRPPCADSGSRLFVSRHAGKLRQELARMNEHFLHLSDLRGGFPFLELVGVG